MNINSHSYSLAEISPRSFFSPPKIEPCSFSFRENLFILCDSHEEDENWISFSFLPSKNSLIFDRTSFLPDSPRFLARCVAPIQFGGSIESRRRQSPWTQRGCCATISINKAVPAFNEISRNVYESTLTTTTVIKSRASRGINAWKFWPDTFSTQCFRLEYFPIRAVNLTFQFYIFYSRSFARKGRSSLFMLEREREREREYRCAVKISERAKRRFHVQLSRSPGKQRIKNFAPG